MSEMKFSNNEREKVFWVQLVTKEFHFQKEIFFKAFLYSCRKQDKKEEKAGNLPKRDLRSMHWFI